MRRSSVPVALVAALMFTGCGGGNPSAVARAADHELSVSEAVEILSHGSNLANWTEATREIANLWIDYTLLAKAAMEDTAMAQLDVSAMVNSQVEQVLLRALRDSVVKVNPRITDPQRRSRAFAAAESSYVAQLEKKASPEIASGAADVVRQIARDPAIQLSEEAAKRPLVTYDGGAVTVDDVRQFLATRPPPFRRQIANGAADSLIDSGVLHLLTRRQLLLAEARRQGWQVRAKDRAPLVARSRAILRSTARELGLLSIAVPAGQSKSQAIDETVKNVLDSIVGGQRNATNLGSVSGVLRSHYSSKISQPGIDEVVARLVQTH